MRIAIASLGDPSSVRTWSGIPASIIKSLEDMGHQLLPVPLTPPKEPWHYSWLRRYYHRVHKKWFLSAVEQNYLKKISAQLDGAVELLKPNVVLVIHGDWLAYTSFTVPACIVHDTTFASIVDYYPSFTNLSSRSLKQGNEMYRRALDRAKAAVFSARWASSSAIVHYKTSPSKVFTVPFGAGLSYEPTFTDIKRWIDVRASEEICNFLFIGTQWKRKGGPDALAFIAELNRMGIPSKLTIVGCEPDIPADYAYSVDVKGYLRKDVDAEDDLFHQLLETAHALIVPSEAECFGCVYCEANAYGLPALGRDTGGIPEIIKDGFNGFLLRATETPQDLARRWAQIWRDRKLYKMISWNAHREFKSRLNRKSFAEKLENILINITAAS